MAVGGRGVGGGRSSVGLRRWWVKAVLSLVDCGIDRRHVVPVMRCGGDTLMAYPMCEGVLWNVPTKLYKLKHVRMCAYVCASLCVYIVCVCICFKVSLCVLYHSYLVVVMSTYAISTIS